MPDAPSANAPRVEQIVPTLGQRPDDALEDLHATALKLGALGDLVGQAPDLGVVDRDGLGILLSDMARDVDRCAELLRAR
jgi:hypothetical protein